MLGAASDWHYMLFAKRTAIIEIIFAARVNPPPSLSLSAAVSPPFSLAFSLFCVYLAFSVPPLIPIFLLPHSIPIAFVTSSFLFLCLLVAFLVLQHFNVISLLFLLFLCCLIVSFSLSLSHIHKEIPSVWSFWSQKKEVWFPKSTKITSSEYSLWIIEGRITRLTSLWQPPNSTRIHLRCVQFRCDGGKKRDYYSGKGGRILACKLCLIFISLCTLSFLWDTSVWWPRFCPQSDSEVNILNILSKSRHHRLLTL